MKARQKGKQSLKFKLIAQCTEEARTACSGGMSVGMQKIIQQYKEWIEKDKEDANVYHGVLCGSKE